VQLFDGLLRFCKLGDILSVPSHHPDVDVSPAVNTSTL
jgi:hypothetical protein